MLVSYDLPKNVFDLSINDLPFSGMPYQAQVILQGPQNITCGEIILNDVQVHEGWVQFSVDYTIDEWISEIDKEPITDIAIKRFECSSSEMVNSVFEGLATACKELGRQRIEESAAGRET